MPSGRIDHPHQGQADMDIGALKGKKGMKELKECTRGKEKDTKEKACTKENAKERAKDTKAKEKE